MEVNHNASIQSDGKNSCKLIERAFVENFLKTAKILDDHGSDFSHIYYEKISEKISEKLNLDFKCKSEIRRK